MTTTTRITRHCCTLLMALGLGTPMLASADTLRFGGNFPNDHSSSKAMEIFQEELANRTDGDLTAQLFPAMQLGGAGENIDQVSSGAVMGTWVGIAYLSRIVAEFEALSLPFAFDNREDAFRVIDGKVGDMLNQKLAEKGFTALGYMELGFRNVTNNEHPIKEPEDFKGLKIRLQPNQTHLDTFRALGANPVSMGIKEVYSGLQQGVIDGQENPYSVIATRRLDEVQKYLSDSRHFYDYIVIIANLNKFESLSDEEQQAVRDSMDVAVEWQRSKAAEEDKAARQTLIDRGMEFTSLSDETREALRKETQGVVDELKNSLGADIVETVQAELDK
ncbi:TRAP transporter substrate-binding protein [Vreelandella subglaciescola]|uniref:Tripartite ATP-independent transporter solute receptor, DctP family n=1 Tax=Vreelandella subglaciescola TaxID=29571 RepID=A0A1M7GSI0_9GAMM|nr:TRAP transporter substrate-binding protein [Halomonas subglaciescola]SHM19334.1 tripartite ATP-independent transporter solute receptor, DctP family [Halomonas subglaciescola]